MQEAQLETVRTTWGPFHCTAHARPQLYKQLQTVPQGKGQTRPQQLLSALLSPSYVPWWLHTSFLTRFSMQKCYIQPVLHHLYAVFLFVSHSATHWVKNVKDHFHFIDLPQGLTPRSPRDFRQNTYLLTSNHRSVKSVHLCDSTKKRLS